MWGFFSFMKLVQIDTVGPFYVSNGGLPAVYSTVQFHFHWGHENDHGSEHLIDGRASPLEVSKRDNSNFYNAELFDCIKIELFPLN